MGGSSRARTWTTPSGPALPTPRTDEDKRADWEQAQEPVFRPDMGGGDFSDTAEYIRGYYDEHPAA